IRLDYDKREKWETTLRASMPHLATVMGIPGSNLRWVAAFHQAKGHPHVHVVIWEKNPHRIKGVLRRDERIAVKREFMRKIYADERNRLTQEKTAMRDLIRSIAKEDAEKSLELVREVNQLQRGVSLE